MKGKTSEISPYSEILELLPFVSKTIQYSQTQY